MNNYHNQKLIIRTFNQNDTEEVIHLWEQCGLTVPWNDPHKDINRKLSERGDLFFVGERDGKIMASAMAGFDGHRGSVFYLAVHPDYQKKGYGKKLMKHVEDILLKEGCPKINIMVRTANLNVLSFYDHLGYRQDDVVVLGKRLISDEREG